VALMAHLGMSGQLLMQDGSVPDEKHLKVRLRLSSSDGMPEQLRFVDQRIFGGLFVTSLVPTDDGGPGGLAESPLPLIAEEASHIARDPLDPAFSFDLFYRRLRKRKTGLKRALLDQGLVSGIGNIYADEALWRARCTLPGPRTPSAGPKPKGVLGSARDVMPMRWPPAAPASTRCTSTSTARPGTSTGPSTPMAGRDSRASGAPLRESTQ
jgi:formamidopyrimidine-DNA glycosylase